MKKQVHTFTNFINGQVSESRRHGKDGVAQLENGFLALLMEKGGEDLISKEEFLEKVTSLAGDYYDHVNYMRTF